MDVDDQSQTVTYREKACKLTFGDYLTYIFGLLLFLFVLHMLTASWHS